MVNLNDIILSELNNENIGSRIDIINDDKNYKIIGLDKKITKFSNEKWFEKYSHDVNKKFFIIKNGDVPCGLIGLSMIDKKRKNADLFIAISGAFKGQGIGYQAMMKLIEYAKDVLKLTSVYLTVDMNNENAINLYKQIGFIENKNYLSENELKFVFWI